MRRFAYTHMFVVLFVVIALMDVLTPAFGKAGAGLSEEPVTVRLRKYHVKPSFQQQFRKALSVYVHASLKAAGNVMAEAYYEEQDPSVLWIIERWTGNAASDKNDKSSAAAKIGALVKEGLVSPVEVILLKDLEPLPLAAYRRAPRAHDRPLTIMLSVDAKAGTEGEFMSRYHEAMPAFRAEPGVVTYQLSQVSADKTKFYTYEKFRSQQAFEAHLKIPAVVPVIDYLHTSIKEQPFEKGLHRLIELAPLRRE